MIDYFAAKRRRPSGLTLIEMLIAIAITLVMMGAVATIFASVSQGLNKRRSGIEMATQLANVRYTLASDLEGATCTTLPWQRPEASQGYFEVVEGLYCDFYPSSLTDGIPNNGELDPANSTVPLGVQPGNDAGGQYVQSFGTTQATAVNGLGDWDDILAFTSRNEDQPFIGRVPSNNIDINNGNARLPFANWGGQTLSSPLAEVVWFAVENPITDTGGLLAEAGYRTIYRRVLLIVPYIDYRYDGVTRPGVLRILEGQGANDATAFDFALAALVSFQERYDISARVEFDINLDRGNGGTWVIIANTLADLTKRENRYEHHGYVVNNGNAARLFPYRMVSAGSAVPGSVSLRPDGGNAIRSAIQPVPDAASSAVESYIADGSDGPYMGRPFAFTDGDATVRVMVDEDGVVRHATTGLVPLGVIGPRQSRRGEDSMLSQALAFDVRVFDPQAPVFVEPATETTVEPGDAGWRFASGGSYRQISTGAYVDLGYARLHEAVATRLGSTADFTAIRTPFAGLMTRKSQLADGRFTRVYDTWSLHYENNGLNEDAAFDGGLPLVDEGTDGFDNPETYFDSATGTQTGSGLLFGPDDAGERETAPPYNSPLRGIQVRLRVYEPDSKQVREVTVRQHFVPE